MQRALNISYPIALTALLFAGIFLAATFVRQKHLEAAFGHKHIQPSTAIVQARP